MLEGVTGKIRPGRVTAVMGPSGMVRAIIWPPLKSLLGAGKTTFLTTLAGKASYGVRTGTILINGQPTDISKYKKVCLSPTTRFRLINNCKLIGFVPQEDIMHRELTVKEIIRYLIAKYEALFTFFFS